MATSGVKTALSNVVISLMSLCFVMKIESSFLNIEELQKSKYGVELSANPVLLNSEVYERYTFIIYNLLKLLISMFQQVKQY